jgi:SAM-dependent methyltransferase
MMNAERKQRIGAVCFNYETQPKIEILNCNLCGGCEFTIISHQDRYGYATQAHLCHDCGLVALNPRMTADAYTVFYRSIYRPLVSAFHGRLIDARTIQDEQRDYARQLAQFLVPYMARIREGTLLDVGGSTGIVSEHLLQQFELKATVLDPAPEELANAKNLGMDVVAGFLEDYRVEPDNRFDLIVLCQTIDHLLDVNSSLRKIKQLLKPNGLFFVDIVDFRAAYIRNQSVEDAIKVDHPYYLTESTMETYLRRLGFGILRKNYASDHLHIGYLCVHTEPENDLLPDPSQVQALKSEIRMIQNQGKCHS